MIFKEQLHYQSTKNIYRLNNVGDFKIWLARFPLTPQLRAINKKVM